MNKPSAGSKRPTPDTARLRAGRAFGELVADYYKTGQPYIAERRVCKAHLPRMLTGTRGRIDVIMVVDESERSAMIVEAKNTDWAALYDRGSARRNLQRHCLQVWSYLNGQLFADDGSPIDLASFAASYAALVYPHAPASAEVRRLVEEFCGEQLITVIWFNELPSLRAQVTEHASADGRPV
jgi:hypothetical protein